MKKILYLAFLIIAVSCKKESSVNEGTVLKDSTGMGTLDSIHIPTIYNAENPAPFTVISQDLKSEKGRVIFTKEGGAVFFFDQNSSVGSISIDGQKYVLYQVDFNENNYKLSGKEVQIEATDGVFSDATGDCITGNFAEAKINFKGKTLNLTDITVQDCTAN
jgi:hypothetical protein